MHFSSTVVPSKHTKSNSGQEDVFYLAQYWKALLTSHISLELPAVKRMQYFSSLKCYSTDYTTDMFQAVWITRLNTNAGNKDVAKRLPAPEIMGSPAEVLQLHRLKRPNKKLSAQKMELIVKKKKDYKNPIIMSFSQTKTDLKFDGLLQSFTEASALNADLLKATSALAGFCASKHFLS